MQKKKITNLYYVKKCSRKNMKYKDYKTDKCHHRVRLEAVAAKKIERYKKVPLEKGLQSSKCGY